MFKSIDEIKAANKARGHHFFDADTMAFFDSRIEGGVFGGRYFITSEQFHFRGETFPRKYTVRRGSDDGSIDTVLGTWQEFDSAEAARAHMHVEEPRS